MTASPWAESIATIQAKLRSGRAPQVTGTIDAVDLAAAATVGAHAVFANSSPRSTETILFGCVSAAADVLRAAAAAVRAMQTLHTDDGEAQLVARLEDALADHDSLVWAGEVPDALTTTETSKPTARLLGALGSLRTGGADRDHAVQTVATNAVALAALLVRAGLNVKLTGQPTWDPGRPRPPLSTHLWAVAAELGHWASELGAAGMRASADLVTTNLEAARRAPVPGPALKMLTSPSADPRDLREALGAARAGWIRIAGHELLVVQALDRDLPAPSSARFGGLEDAIVAGTTNVLCASRLGREPQRFRHAEAWARQHKGLDYAADTYRRGPRGDSDVLHTTQLIVLTRLLRAVAAIAVIDRRISGRRGS